MSIKIHPKESFMTNHYLKKETAQSLFSDYIDYALNASLRGLKLSGTINKTKYTGVNRAETTELLSNTTVGLGYLSSIRTLDQ